MNILRDYPACPFALHCSPAVFDVGETGWRAIISRSGQTLRHIRMLRNL